MGRQEPDEASGGLSATRKHRKRLCLEDHSVKSPSRHLEAFSQRGSRPFNGQPTRWVSATPNAASPFGRFFVVPERLTIRMFDAPLHGERSAAGGILLDAGPATLRDLIRGRLQQEVERYNKALPETFQGLVQPDESEQVLNGFRMKTKRPLDWEAQCRRACSSFEKNGFLVLVDGTQVTELDSRFDLHEDSEIDFIKLVPLVGG